MRFCECSKTDTSEDDKVKHVKAISMRGSAKATATEDFICAMTAILNSLLGFFGGSSPLLLFIEDKCAIPTPNTGGN